MESGNLYRLFTIDEQSVTPKYQQLTQSILKAIASGSIRRDDPLPSINEMSFELEISRDTIEKGYRHLKKLGILGSVPGKGYYIANTEFRQPLRVFLLFNKLSTHKKIIFDAFSAALGDQAAIDFYIYNNDFTLFRKLLHNKKEFYSHFVIIPHFTEGGDRVRELLNEIPKEKLIIMDKLVEGIDGSYGAVFENFDQNIHDALEQALERLRRYHTLRIIFPEYTYHPREILNGFQRFCTQYDFISGVVQDVSREPIGAGEVFINLMEQDLVTLIERIISMDLQVGRDVGVISYNETPLKKIILQGITTISTDFTMMGEAAAKMILDKTMVHIAIPFYLTLRDSL